MKKIKLLFLLSILLLGILALTACDFGEEDFETYTLTLVADKALSDAAIDGDASFSGGGYASLVITKMTEGYYFDGWYEGDTLLSDSLSYSLRVDKNMTVTCRIKAVSESKIIPFDTETEELSVSSQLKSVYYRFTLTEDALVKLYASKSYSSSAPLSDFRAVIYTQGNYSEPVVSENGALTPLAAGNYIVKAFANKADTGSHRSGKGKLTLYKTALSGVLTLNSPQSFSLAKGQGNWYKLSVSRQTAVNLILDEPTYYAVGELYSPDELLSSNKLARAYSHGAVLSQGDYFLYVYSNYQAAEGSITAEEGVLTLGERAESDTQTTTWKKITLSAATAVAPLFEYTANAEAEIYAAEDLDTVLLTHKNGLGTVLPAGDYFLKYSRLNSSPFSLRVIDFSTISTEELTVGEAALPVTADGQGSWYVWEPAVDTDVTLIFSAFSNSFWCQVYVLNDTKLSLFVEKSISIKQVFPAGTYYIRVRQWQFPVDDSPATGEILIEAGTVLPLGEWVYAKSSETQWFSMVIREETGVGVNRAVSFYQSNRTTLAFNMAAGEVKIFEAGEYLVRIPIASTAYGYQFTSVFVTSQLSEITLDGEPKEIAEPLGTYGVWHKVVISDKTAVCLDVSAQSGTPKATLYEKGNSSTLVTEGMANRYILSAGTYYVKYYGAAGTLAVRKNLLALNTKTDDLTLNNRGAWFQLVLTEQTAVNLHPLHISGNTSLYADLYRESNQSSVLVSASTANGNAGASLQAGTYFIKLYANNTSYSVIGNLTLKEGVITLGEEINFSDAGSAGLYYKLTVDEFNKYDFSLQMSGSSALNVVISGKPTITDGISLHFDAGAYFIRLYSSSRSTTGTFSINSNTTLALLGEQSDSVTANTAGVWYRFSVEERTAVNLHITRAAQSYVYASVYASSNLLTKKFETTTLGGTVFEPGTYYIKFFTYSGTAEGTFILSQDSITLDTLTKGGGSSVAWYLLTLDKETVLYLDPDSTIYSAPRLYSASSPSTVLLQSGYANETRLAEGDYYISSNVDFTVVARWNYTVADAKEITINSQHEKTMATAANQAWFKLVLDEETAVSLAGDYVNTSISSVLYDSQLSPLMYGKGSFVLTQGTYYIAISAGRITLKVLAYTLELNQNAGFSVNEAVYVNVDLTEFSAVRLTMAGSVNALLYAADDLNNPLCAAGEGALLDIGRYYIKLTSSTGSHQSCTVYFLSSILTLNTLSAVTTVNTKGIWYSLTLPQTTSIRLFPTGGLKAALFSKSNQSTPLCTDGQSVILTQDTYYVRLYASSGSATGAVTVTGRSNLAAESAVAFTDSTPSVTVGAEENFAWYKFTVSGSAAAINLSVTATEGALLATLYRSSDLAAPIATADSSYRGGAFLSTGTYLIRLSATASSATGLVTLQNGILNLDSPTQSEPILYGIYYLLTLTEECAISLHLTASTGILQAEVARQDGTVTVPAFSDYDTSVFSSGIYYIKLSAFGAAAEGQLTAVGHKNITKDTAATLTFDTPAESVTTGDTATAAWYAFTLNRKTALSFTVLSTLGTLQALVYKDGEPSPLFAFNDSIDKVLDEGDYYINLVTTGGLSAGSITVSVNTAVLNVSTKERTATLGAPLWYEIILSNETYVRLNVTETDAGNLLARLYAYDDLTNPVFSANNFGSETLAAGSYFISLETLDTQARGQLVLSELLTVRFYSYDSNLLKTEYVIWGENATPPSAPSRTDYTFTGWSGSYFAVKSHLNLTAQYQYTPLYTVSFYDYNGTHLKTEQVRRGQSANPPTPPARTGYYFTGYSGGNYTNVQDNLTLTAQYQQILYRYGTIYDAVQQVLIYGGTYTSPQTPPNVTVRDVAGNVVGILRFSGWQKISEWEYKAQYTY